MRSRTSSRSRSTAARRPSARAEALNARAAAPTSRSLGPRRRPAGLPRALLGPLALVPLPDLARPRALAVRGRTARSGTRGRSTSQRLDAVGGDARRRARLPRVHADRDAAPRLRPRVVEDARWHDRGDTRRARDHGRLVPAPHGADARRDDARARAGRAREPARRARRAPGGRPDRRPVRASTSSRSRYRRRSVALGHRPGPIACSAGRRLAGRAHTAVIAGAAARGRGRDAWLRSVACAFRSSSSISTAPSSTPAGSSSPRCGTRRGRCSAARFPDEELMAAVGGPGLEAQMREFARRGRASTSSSASTARTTSRCTTSCSFCVGHGRRARRR